MLQIEIESNEGMDHTNQPYVTSLVAFDLMRIKFESYAVLFHTM